MRDLFRTLPPGLFDVAVWSTRACWAEVRMGNISLGVLPGGGDRALSDIVEVSFMRRTTAGDAVCPERL